MPVRKHKGSWWADFSYRGLRYRFRSPASTRVGAVHYEHTLRQRLAEGKKIYPARDARSRDVEVPRLDDFAASWLESYAAPRLKPSTYSSYRLRYERYILPYFGQQRLDAIGTEPVDQFAAGLVRKGLHPKTINNVLCVLRRILTCALDWGKLEHLPRIKWLKAPPSTFDFLTPLEAEHLIATADREPWRGMLKLALHTGLRLGELVALRWSDVDLERRQLCVRRTEMRGVETSPKNNRLRYVPLSTELHAQLLRCARSDGRVFTNRGREVTHSAASNALARLCKKAALRHIGWHVLRHTFASHLVSENVPLVAVQAFLGHSDIKMTQRYAHIAPSMLRTFIEGISSARLRAVDELGHPAVTRTEKVANTATFDSRSYQDAPLTLAKTRIDDARLGWRRGGDSKTDTGQPDSASSSSNCREG